MSLGYIKADPVEGLVFLRLIVLSPGAIVAFTLFLLIVQTVLGSSKCLKDSLFLSDGCPLGGLVHIRETCQVCTFGYTMCRSLLT